MSTMQSPAAFPPPVTPGEFVREPQASGDDVIDVGALFIGGGPAGLAGAIRLAQKAGEDDAVMAKLGEVPIAVVDKGRTVGAHQLSGAVVNPSSLRELFPDITLEQMTSFGEVKKEAVYLLSEKRATKLFPTPRPFHNSGNWIFSLSKLTRFMADKAEDLGVMLLPETSADTLLVHDGVVRGVYTGDKGRGKEGEALANFEPGAELHAQATILSEGTQGHLTGAAIERFALQGVNPQIYALGVKEVWKVAKPLDRIIHTMGWPLRKPKKLKEFGGSFIYPMGDEHVCVGMVVGLDWRDYGFSVHDSLQELKTHPLVRNILEGGERVSWGAKTIPEGGFFALPKSLSVPGLMIAGDAAGMVNVPKLKGVHLAMRAGMLAADTVYERLAAGVDLSGVGALCGYDARVRDSVIHKDLYRSRNMKQVFSKGFYIGGALAFMMDATGGRFPGGVWKTESDSHEAMFDGGVKFPAPDGTLTFDKLSSVFLSGNRTRDDQPSHIRIANPVSEAVARTWVNMCPAAVYELGERAGEGLINVQVNPSNCVHCGAITAKGGKLMTAEGGSGPEYTTM